MDLDKVLEVCKDLAIEAGDEIRKIYDRADQLQVEYKEGNMPLTEADKAANAVIVKGLREKFKDAAILSEEEKDNLERLKNPYCFIVDPLDGTKEFIKRNGQFTVNIALSYQHESILGVIYVPVTDELYFAAKGKGAFMKDANGRTVPIHVDESEKEKRELRVVMSNSHGCKRMDELIAQYQFTNMVKVGSSLKGVMIAKGNADVYYRFNPTMEWDTAAMQCIVEEAGAIFRQIDHSKMTYNREDSVNRNGFYIINKEENQLI